MNITKKQIQEQLEKAKIRVSKMPRWKKIIIDRVNKIEIEIGFLPREINEV
jgi:hypothetical protein